MNNIKVKYDKLKPNLLEPYSKIEALFHTLPLLGLLQVAFLQPLQFLPFRKILVFLSAWYRHLHKQTQCHYGESSCMPLNFTHHLSVWSLFCLRKGLVFAPSFSATSSPLSIIFLCYSFAMISKWLIYLLDVLYFQ